MSEFILPLIMLVIVAFWFVVAYLTRKTNPGSSKLAIRGGILAAVMFIALALIAALQVENHRGGRRPVVCGRHLRVRLHHRPDIPHA